MNVVEQGKEIVFDEEAVCYEDAPSLSSVEFARKVRISMGNFQNLSRYKKLLITFWKGSSFAFLSHKVLRWITPFMLILCFLASVGLSFYNDWFIVIAALQLIGIMTPLVSIELKYFKIVSHFYLMNLALLKGFFIFIGGVDSNIWQPTKRNV
jgi:cellulose synthase/poly-beta-1,6-N-acetylglucosamine synthase-like glycosyltransferase